jgi:hypothetical protein
MGINEIISEHCEEALVLPDNYNKAIIGMASRINFGPVVAYDVEKLIEILATEMTVDKSDLEDEEDTIEAAKYRMAREHYEYNIVGGFHGETMPIFIETEDFKQEE